MRFTIAVHTGHGAPPDAIELLAAALGPSGEDVRFSQSGASISAIFDEEASIASSSDEREGIGRIKLLEILEEVCGGSSGLHLDWYAVSGLLD